MDLGYDIGPFALRFFEITVWVLHLGLEPSQYLLEDLRKLQPLLAASTLSFLELDTPSIHVPIHHIYRTLWAFSQALKFPFIFEVIPDKFSLENLKENLGKPLSFLEMIPLLHSPF